MPRDRDRAFTKVDGLLPWVARRWHPKLMAFDGEYPSMLGLVKNPWRLDRRLLQELDRATWDSTGTALQRSLTDSVIDDAVMHLPQASPTSGGAH
jgi:hypothetical protein